LSKSRNLLSEQNFKPENTAKDIEKNIENTTNQDERQQAYKINGNVIVLHGNSKKELDITNIEKKAFLDSVREFNDEVSELTEFNELKVYKRSVEWSGNITNLNIEFIYIIGENDGVYLNGELIKLDDDTVETLTNLKTYYDMFSNKWGEVLNSRKELES
jgi:hypothetical protein